MRGIQTSNKCSRENTEAEARREIDLLELIFSWSLKDVLNKHLYKEEVEQIPESFLSTVDYLNSFVSPLIEEIRADLCSALENVAQAPVCEITQPTMKQSFPLVYHISTKRINHHDEGNYRPKSGDIFLLTSSRLRNAEVLNSPREDFLMAFVIGEASQRHWNYNIRTSKEIDSGFGPIFPLIPPKPKRFFATYMINLTTYMRIWWALKWRPLASNLSLIESVLHYDSSVTEEDDCSVGFPEKESVNVSDIISSFRLDESQKSAILSSIFSVNNNCIRITGSSKVKLIWGPPGTGKTKTVASLLFVLLKMKRRTVTCAPTNIAVVQVLKRLMDLVLRSPDQYGNCRLGDIILLGNAERMNSDENDNIAKVYLNNRVQILSTSIREWRCCLLSIKALLSDHERQSSEDNNNSMEKSLNIYSLAETLMLCAYNLFAHLPTSCIPLEVERDTISLVDQLKELESMEKKVNNFDDFATKRIELLEHCTRLYVQFPGSTFKGRKNQWNMCLSNAYLIFCTASYSANVDTDVEMVIIDEAAQLKESESIIPLRIPGVRNAVLVGDDRQLPAMVQSKVSENANFGRSLFQRLATLGKQKHILNVQYRMHPSISLFPNREFYENRIIDAPHVKERGYQRNFIDGPMYGAYSFINVDRGRESFTKEHSAMNVGEVEVIEQIIEKLFKGHHIKKQKVSVGIISPYKGQVNLIQEKIGKRYANYKENFAVKIHSIDGFQGGEEDIIIISTVRCNRNGSVGFHSNRQRTNVALTRARYCLWIVGNGDTLIESGSTWKDLVIDAKTRGCFYDADGKSDAKLKCFDSLELGNTRWKVLLTDDFKNSIASIATKKSQQQVHKMLQKIAAGWRQSNTEEVAAISLDGVATEVLKQYKVDEQLYLVWSIDVQKEESKYTQVIKVWNILPASKIPTLAEELNILFRNHTVDFTNRCKHNSFQGNLAVPMSWPLQPAFSAEKPSMKAANDELSSRKRGSYSLEDERETKLRTSTRRKLRRPVWN